MAKVQNISILLPEEPIQVPFEEEINFNNTVREYILFGVVLLVLLSISHIIILRFRRKEILSPHTSHQIHFDDEAVVDRVAIWLCTFSLSISLGAVLLLPISIMTNEVLTIYRESFYVRWINLSLIQGLWNMIFLCSNISLFVGLPFAYLFTESEGFPGSKKGLKSRVVETVVVLSLLVVLIFGVSFIIAFLLGCYEHQSILQVAEAWGSFYLPFMYSLISCLGVLVLLLCTPVGFATVFTALGQLILLPSGFLRDITDEHNASVLREDAVKRRLAAATLAVSSGVHPRPLLRRCICSTAPELQAAEQSRYLALQHEEARQARIRLEERLKAGTLRRALVLPVALVAAAAITGGAALIVGTNTLQLLVGFKALPIANAPAILGETQQGKRIVILSMLGGWGAAVEVLLILYLVAASLLGCYSLAPIQPIRPRVHDTPMVHVIANCLVVLVLSSALPLLVTTIGITNFDLLGEYGEMSWLGQFWIVLAYNVLFATATASCLVKKFTKALRREIMVRFKEVRRLLWKRGSFLPLTVLPTAFLNQPGEDEKMA